MNNSNHLMVGFAATMGGIVGVLAGVMIAARLDTLNFSETVWAAAWSAIAGIVGAAAGGVIAVWGALAAARAHIAAQQAQFERQYQIKKLEEFETTLLANLQELVDIVTAIQPLDSTINLVRNRAKELTAGKPAEISSRGVIGALYNECSDVLSAPIPTTKACGAQVRQRWQLLRHQCRVVAPELEKALQASDTECDTEVWTLNEIVLDGIEECRTAVQTEVELKIEAYKKHVDEVHEVLSFLRRNRNRAPEANNGAHAATSG